MDACSEWLQRWLLNDQKEPVIFKGMLTKWPAAEWTPQNLLEIFGGDLVKFRIGKKNSPGIQWETECSYVEATIQDFLSWLSDECTGDNLLQSFPKDQYWCYADYKYMAEIFRKKEDVLGSVDWSAFGFPGRGGRDSTFWLGSEGAHTICHMDTYGCNLVAQIFGRKKWVLFPPSDCAFLYPTRVPYEESSVFSSVNVMNPDFARHPQFKGCHPHVATLEPGQVLFVPNHWWHYVESVDPASISINTWIELDSDREERMREAITRILTFSLMENNSKKAEWLNPTETATSHSKNMSFLMNSVAQVLLQPCNRDVSLDEPDMDNSYSQVSVKSSLKRKQREGGPSDVIPKKAKGSVEVFPQKAREEFDQSHIQLLSCMDFSEYLRKHSKARPEDFDLMCRVSEVDGKLIPGKSLSTEDFVQCVTHPDVIALICEKIKQKVCNCA